jgi:uncharacterized phage protein gp47/JayE
MISIPSLSDLAARVRNSFRTELPGSDAWLWPNNLSPTAKVIAASLFNVYLRLDYVARQIFAATAEGQWLDRHATEFGLSRRPASLALGNLIMTATAAANVFAGAVFQRSDGVRYTAAGGATLLGAGTASVPVTAAAAGSAGNIIAGTTLTPVSGVTGTATFAVDGDGLGTGADLESDDALRARILFRKRNPPHGGAAADYVMWGTAIPGVSRVFVERLWLGAGTLRVFPVTDGLTVGGVPTAAIVSAVTANIAANAPAGAQVTVVAPTAQPINVTITGLSPNTTAVQTAVLAELRDMFQRLGMVAGIDTPVAGMPFLATAQTFSRSWLWQAIANAAGEERHSVTLPAADVTIAAGSIPVLGTVTFA